MKLMKNVILGASLAISICAMTSAKAAVMLSFSPSSQVASTGDSVSLDLMISGLTAGTADSLGTFDLDVIFDDSRLSLTSYLLTDLLGDSSAFEADDLSLGEYIPGLIGLSLLSYLDIDELDNLQPSSFSLATFNFDVISLEVGQATTVAIDTVFALGDAFGNALTIDSMGEGILRNPAEEVSTPASLGIFILGVLLVMRRKYQLY
ncbi:hypothetical protein KO519_06705 [Paraglaciecola agarilytica]|uniref:hypothetical protein n=1 Tax=Paraglaciecola chathamensis TaxID=368405 RepID=UPI001C08545C|nr:hypothetical protein [Paraglaciecola agarilytica]MBU3017388.1 hypothetical protein [Paraglaciecola agarilytica]